MLRNAEGHIVVCREAGPVQVVYDDFQASQYWWELECPDCGERHPSLDRAEFSGAHPW